MHCRYLGRSSILDLSCCVPVRFRDLEKFKAPFCMLILYRILERYVNQLTYLLVYSFQIVILELTVTAKLHDKDGKI